MQRLTVLKVPATYTIAISLSGKQSEVSVNELPSSLQRASIPPNREIEMLKVTHHRHQNIKAPSTLYVHAFLDPCSFFLLFASLFPLTSYFSSCYRIFDEVVRSFVQRFHDVRV